MIGLEEPAYEDITTTVEDGRTYVDNPWPDRILVSRPLLNTVDGFILRRDGLDILLFAENGAARYRIVGADTTAEGYRCELADSETRWVNRHA